MRHLRSYSDFVNEDFTPYDYSNSLEEEDYDETPFPESAVTAVMRRGSHSKEIPTDYPMFFTENEYVAESYGYYVREAHINITNLLDLYSAGEGLYGEGLTRKLLPFVYTPAEIAFIEKSNLLDARMNLDAMCYELHGADFEVYYNKKKMKDRSVRRSELERSISTEYFDKILGADNAADWAHSYTDGQLFMLRNAIGHPLTTVMNFDGGTHNMEKVFTYAQKNGYDGIMMKDESSDVQQQCISYVVFDPKQISWIREYKHNAY